MTTRRRSHLGAPLFFFLVLVLALAIAASGCTVSSSAGDTAATGTSDDDADGSADAPATEAIPVELVTLETGPVQEMLRASTNLEAERAVAVYAKTTGLVEERRFEEGDRVREGQILIRLEDDEARNAVLKAEAELAKAQREFERQKKLHAENLISDQEFNNGSYEIERLGIVLADAKLALAYTEIRAPITGTVTARMVDRGQLVNPSQHLVDIVDFDSLVARIYVPERELARVREGQDALLQSQALGGVTFDARVLRVAPTVDPKSGTVKVTVAVGAQPGLRPGLFVDVQLITATQDEALLLPKRALVYDADRTFVYRVGDDLVARRVLVEPALVDRDHVVPADGLARGERVVIAGQAGLKDGALVKIPSTTPAAPTATAAKTPGASS